MRELDAETYLTYQGDGMSYIWKKDDEFKQ